MDKFLTKASSNPNLTANSSSKRPAEDAVDQWNTPKRTVKPGSTITPEFHPLPTNNRFNVLSTDVTGATSKEDKLLQPSSPYRKATTSVKKTGHVPPIIIEINQEWTHETIKNLISPLTKHYHLQYRGRNKVAVICYSPDAHQCVKEGLRGQNVSFLTYTRKDERTLKAVMRGLPAYVENGLPDELDSLGFKGTKVTKLQSAKSADAPCPPFLIHLPPGSDIIKFRQIRYLFNCVVTITKYKPFNNTGTQCFRCQGFGHSSKNCNMPVRCVKCVDKHPIGECLKKDRSEPAKCVNCNEEHPANYRKCSARLIYLKRIHQEREVPKPQPHHAREVPKPQPQAPNITKSTDSNRKWSDVLRGQNNPPQAKTQEFEECRIPKDTHDDDTSEMLNILKTLKILKNEFKACTSMLDKVVLVLSHLGQYV